MGASFLWTYRGVLYSSVVESRCPHCGGGVVRLPPALIAEQTDNTTHVCHSAIGGCNAGFSDVLDNVGRALAAAGYAATFEAFERALREEGPHRTAESVARSDVLFDALDEFELADPAINDRRVEVLAALIGEVEDYRDPSCQQCKGDGWLTGPADAPFERAIPCYACAGRGR